MAIIMLYKLGSIKFTTVAQTQIYIQTNETLLTTTTLHHVENINGNVLSVTQTFTNAKNIS